MSYLINAPMSHPVFAQARWENLDWVHKQVMAIFGPIAGDGTARSRANVLFRVEPRVRGGRVLVQASQQPEVDGIETRPLGPVLDALTDGVPVRLLLRVNAVRTVNRTGDDGLVRTHRAHVPPDQFDTWLASKLHGFELTGPLDVATSYERFKRTPLYVATVTGTAVVTDATQARATVTSGVGKARSYGCGMLSVLPV
jgi:CRISPR system Cascade subunit CasE